MLNLKKAIIVLGITVTPFSGIPKITFYKQKLQQEIIHEKQILENIKQLEYKFIWTEAIAEEKKDFVVGWFKKNKVDEQLKQSQKELKITRKKIMALKQILEKDSLSHLPPKFFSL